jgi:O-antigen ligase
MEVRNGFLSQMKVTFLSFVLISPQLIIFKGRKTYRSSETMLFWGTLFGACVFWCIFSFVSLLSISPTNFFITTCGAILNVVNFVSFIKCAREARAHVQSQVQGYVINQAMSGALNQQQKPDDSSSESD